MGANSNELVLFLMVDLIKVLYYVCMSLNANCIVILG